MKKIKIRKLAAGDRPRTDRSTEFLRLKQELLSGGFGEMPPRKRVFFKQGYHQLRSSTLPRRKGEPEGHVLLSGVRSKKFLRARSLFYLEMAKRLTPPSPELDSASLESLEPGSIVTLFGAGFRTAGRVIYEVQPGRTVDLTILSWSATEIQAQLSPELEGVRGHANARLWIKIRFLQTSNNLTRPFYPQLVEYRSSFGYWAEVWPSAEHNEPFCLGQTLGDSDFNVSGVSHVHGGDGHTELVPANAGGQSLEQWLHWGAGFQWEGVRCDVVVTYRVKGPKGVFPPRVPPLLNHWSE